MEDSSVDSPVRALIAFPSPNEAPHQLAVLEHEGGTLLAVGTGSYVAVVSGELCEVLQLVGPHEHTVGCADWSRGGASLAVGAGCEVAFYEDTRAGASRWVARGTARLDEPVHALRWAGPAVWTASGCMLARWTCTEGRWSKDWSCSVAQPVELMAPSPDGALLATAGRFDRLVKVWHRAQVRPARRPGARPDDACRRGAWCRPSVCVPLPLAAGHVCLQLPAPPAWAADARVETARSPDGAPPLRPPAAHALPRRLGHRGG